MRLEKSINASINGGPRDPAEANVTARLFKSNPVQNALPEILNDIRTLLGVDETSTKKQPQKKADQTPNQKDHSTEEAANELKSKPDEVSSKRAKDEKSKFYISSYFIISLCYVTPSRSIYHNTL